MVFESEGVEHFLCSCHCLCASVCALHEDSWKWKFVSLLLLGLWTLDAFCGGGGLLWPLGSSQSFCGLCLKIVVRDLISAQKGNQYWKVNRAFGQGSSENRVRPFVASWVWYSHPSNETYSPKKEELGNTSSSPRASVITIPELFTYALYIVIAFVLEVLYLAITLLLVFLSISCCFT